MANKLEGTGHIIVSQMNKPKPKQKKSLFQTLRDIVNRDKDFKRAANISNPYFRPTSLDERKIMSFSEYLSEERKDPKSTTYHAFDIDETLFSHDHNKLKIHVKDKKTGRVVKSLNNQQYNTHKLQPGHEYDYSEFRSSEHFKKSSKPIRKMIAKLKAIHKNNKNVEMVTARQDFDDKHKFAKHMGKYGIDVNQIHVRRAGNINPTGHPAVNKAKVISGLIKDNGYKKVHLYDDSQSNLDHFLALKKHHPDVEFHAHHIDHNPSTGSVSIKTTKA